MLRIARSKATFFRDDPIDVLNTIASSTDFRVNVETLVTHNRRNEFSDAAFLDQLTCKELLGRENNNQTNRDERNDVEIRRCIDFAESNIGLRGIWGRYVLSKENKNLEMPDENKWKRNISLLGLSSSEVSKGETLNLYADLYQRGCLQAIG